jgi:phage FluMu protein Com
MGKTRFERLLTRYEETEKKCPACGYVDEAGNWTSETDGREVVYRHTCPSCAAVREHVFEFEREEPR